MSSVPFMHLSQEKTTLFAFMTIACAPPRRDKQRQLTFLSFPVPLLGKNNNRTLPPLPPVFLFLFSSPFSFSGFDGRRASEGCEDCMGQGVEAGEAVLHDRTAGRNRR